MLFSLIYSYFTSRVSDNILKGIKAALRAEIVFDSLDKFLAGNQINVIL